MKDILRVYGVVYSILGLILAIFVPLVVAEQLGGGLAFLFFLMLVFILALPILIIFTFSILLDNQESILKMLNMGNSNYNMGTQQINEESESSIFRDLRKKNNQTEEEKSSEKMNEFKVKNLLKNKYFENGPVIMRSMDLYTSESEAKIQIRMKNISDKEISYVRVALKVRNVFNELMEEDLTYVYQDLSILPGEAFGEKNFIHLASPLADSVEIEVKDVLFASGEKWVGENKQLMDLPELELFKLENYMDEIEKLKTAREIFTFLESLPFQNDTYFKDTVIPEIRGFLDLERLYGNQSQGVKEALEKSYAER